MRREYISMAAPPLLSENGRTLPNVRLLIRTFLENREGRESKVVIYSVNRFFSFEVLRTFGWMQSKLILAQFLVFFDDFQIGNRIKKVIFHIHWNFDEKSCFVMFFHEWNKWKNPQFKISSKNLSIEHNFFKWNRNVTTNQDIGEKSLTFEFNLLLNILLLRTEKTEIIA